MESIIENTQALIRKDLLLDNDQCLDEKYKQAVQDYEIAKKAISGLERERKSLELVDGVNVLNSHIALVKSQSKKAHYTVDYILKTCECADYKYRGVTCKHIQAVLRVVSCPLVDVV